MGNRYRSAPGKMVAMPRFVALLGGINVGGHRVTMDRLRAEVASLGFTDVATFIASGNVLFSATGRAERAGAHEAQLQAHLEAALGWPVPTFVRTAAEILAATDARPFGAVPDGHTHMVVFCRTSPSATPPATPLDRFEIVGREVHWLIAGKLLESTITLLKLAKVIGPNTTRNITSLERLAELVR